METNVQETSIETYHDEVKPTLGARHKRVMEALATRADFTNLELATYLGWPINTATPRVFELREMGLVVESSKRLDAGSGRKAIAWRLATTPEKTA